MQQTRGGSVTIPKGGSMMVAQPLQRAQAQYQCINPGKVSLLVSVSASRFLLHARLQARMICAPNVIPGGV